MSKREKLIQRFLSIPNDLTFDELTILLGYFNFEPVQTGKTGGSRVRFVHQDSKRIISLHKPHPGNIVKTYAIKNIKEKLIEYGYINDETST